MDVKSFKLNQFVLSVVLLSGIISQCTVTSVHVEDDRIAQLYEKIETAFLVNNSNELNNMRETFFPSTLSHYWQADGLEIIDIDVCLKINNISSLYSCSSGTIKVRKGPQPKRRVPLRNVGYFDGQTPTSLI